MAVSVVTFVGTKAVDAESATGWNAGSLDNDTFIEGSGSIGTKVSNTTQDFYDLSVTGSPYDFSSGGGNEGEHIWVWFNTLTPASLHAIIVVDDLATDSIGRWNVGPASGYPGGWVSYVIDPSADFDTVVAGTATWTLSGNPAQLTGVDGFGGRHTTSTTIMGNFNNALVDACSIGEGYRITNGDGASADAVFADFITFENNSSNRYGALRSDAGVLFPLCKLYIGASTGSTATEFTDDGFTVVWPDAVVASDFYELIFVEATGTTDVTLSNGALSSEADPVTMTFSGVTSADFTQVNVNSQGGDIALDGAVTWAGGTLTECGVVDLGGQPTLSSLIFVDPQGTSSVSSDAAAVTIHAANETDNVTDITFDGAGLGGTSQDAAVEIDISGAGPFTIDLEGWIFQNRVAGSVDLHFLANGNADYTVNITGGGSTPTYTNDGSGTVSIVVNPVAHTVNVTDESGTAISGARVMTWPTDNTGPIPFEESISITRSGSTATVSHTAHGLNSNEYVWVQGADQAEYNGVNQVTVTDANTYTYTVSGTPATPATGTITGTGLVLFGTTNGSGVITYTRAYSASQDVQGRVREATGAPFYQPATYTSTISSSAGSTVNITLLDDE